ncbi:MAG: hypothetical protein IKD70_06950 [Eggerthellaceae bacterium]|nr:hypothetical protein [Eggerthellaceae bacterium]
MCLSLLFEALFGSPETPEEPPREGLMGNLVNNDPVVNDDFRDYLDDLDEEQLDTDGMYDDMW